MLNVLEIMREFGVRLGFLQSTYLPVTLAIAVYKRYLAPKRTIDGRYKRDMVTCPVYASFDTLIGNTFYVITKRVSDRIFAKTNIAKAS
jgi:hypothetical protein